MKLTVNGNARECRATNLADLWREETAALEIAEPRGFAISINGEVVRRAAWPATPVRGRRCRRDHPCDVGRLR